MGGSRSGHFAPGSSGPQSTLFPGAGGEGHAPDALGEVHWAHSTAPEVPVFHGHLPNEEMETEREDVWPGLNSSQETGGV